MITILFIYAQVIGESMLAIITFIWLTTYPFWIGLIVTYSLAPLVLHIERMGLHRTIAIIILFIWLFFVLFMVIYVVYPYFVSQLDMFASQLPKVMESFDRWMDQMHAHIDTFPKMVHDQFYEVSYTFLENIQGKIDRFLRGFSQKLNVFLSLFILPIIVFYLLRDGHKWEALLLQLLGRRQRNKVIHIRDIALTHLRKYMWSQLFITVIVACMLFIVYYFLDIPYAFLFALFASMMNIIPYIGPVIGAIPAIIAASQSGWFIVSLVILFTILVQVIENACISPYIIGKQIELHPLAVIFAVFIGAELAGVVGMILMIPLFSIGKAIIIEMKQMQDIDIDN